MIKKLTPIALALAFSFSASASETTCYGQEFKQFTCEEVTLIDFNEDASIETASMGFSDWTQKVEDTYTRTEGDGSAVYAGSNGGYNYSGVQGNTEHDFINGEAIIATFRNTGSEPISFYPHLTFDTPSRLFDNETGMYIRSHDLVTIYPNSTLNVEWGISHGQYTKVTASSVAVNAYVNDSNQPDVEVDKISYRHISNRDAPVDCNGYEYDTYDCTTYNLVDFRVSKAETELSMQVSTLGNLLPNDTLFFDSTAGGVGSHFVNNGSSAENALIAGGYYLYTGVKANEGEKHYFAPGDVIEVYYRTSDLDGPISVTPHISFTDPDSVPYGQTGTWYTGETKSVGANHSDYFTFIFDEQTAGEYGVVNVSLPTDNGGKLYIDNIKYKTRQTSKVTFQ